MSEILTIFMFQTSEDKFDSLCILNITSKQIHIINQNKLMTKVIKKLEDVYVNL